MSTAPSTERKSITPTTNDTQTTQNNGSTSSTSVTVPSTTHAAAASTPSAPPLKRQESSARSAILRLVSDYNELLSEANDGCSASPVTEDNMVYPTCSIFSVALFTSYLRMTQSLLILAISSQSGFLPFPYYCPYPI